ncbi:cardiolipin synthase [Weizmannia acidilactici]|uniref:Cardiolipin synthase n=1 Tax=Weizmannia acidilactici TaxID=2607726 RepID=A0A5J4J3D8_9BACI|nr:phospholipase D-like domain-containing protein [Weizmannia acidilactici]GER69512.1 cardiolipin synthase [Weizmannia acidilactici]
MILLLSLSAAAALVIWLITDYTLGKKHFCSICHKREYPIRAGDFTIFTSGEDLFPQYFSDIGNAKESIYVLFYIVNNDGISRDLFNLLAKKAREDIDVKVLLDWAGSRRVTKKMISQLEQAGASFAVSHRPTFPFFFFSLQQRNHRKITVIDGKIGYIGGFNVGKEYIGENPALSPWRDYHFRLTGGSIGDLQQEFILNWNEAAKEKMSAAMAVTPRAETEGLRHQIIPTEGIDLEDLLCELIDRARSSIFIGSPYFIPTAKIQKKLVRALERGVKLVVLAPGKADHMLVKEAAFRFFRELLKKGAEIYLFNPGFYHAKIVIIDEAVCDIGTANFDRRSVLLNLEINCLVYDAGFIQKMREVFMEDTRHAIPLTLEDINHPGWFSKAKEWGARAIEEFL